ncbi:unnamed protein product [Rotaria magnacalcarata]|uniref:Peptidase M16 N-terminal domain-containing protein n=1 Tax=Rotaria magnacalcarata TaxID=392030 RepID=A0A816LKN5_9BILA|nr:unnamed protein product [Rotaria magnacalcarata]
MVIKSLLPLSDEKEKNHKHEQHVLITEYLIGTNKTTIETKEDEHNIIAVSPNDHRWYRLIELRNGLRCMLVTNNLLENEEDEQEQEEEDEKINQHDTEGLSSDAEEAFFKYHMTTVALYIPAGSLLDPSNVQGLAHLTEHLIFSSSSKYPEMNCLDSFVSYHGGTIRAYTELEFTVIVIEISSNRVVETLDILIHSLIDPLMLSETIFDQVQVIDEESTIAQFDDHYRASRLLAHLAKENHPIRNFSWGNKKSLKEFASNVNSTTILKQLVKDRYCIPEGMNLVMISDESFRVMQQRVERLFCLMKRSYKILPDYIGLKEPWNTDNFQKFHLEVFYMTQNLLELGYIPKILLPSLRATQLPVQQTITKVESYQSNDCATHMLIVFEHGITSIRDYILIEILAEIIQESLEDYLQTVGQNHFTCNAKQTIDNSLQTCIDRYWTEIILNSLVFDRHSRERNSLDTLTVTDMQEWFNEHIIGSTRRQLIIIVCPQDEVRRKPIDIIQSNRASHGTHDNQQNRHSIRSNGTVSIERLSRLVHRQDLFEDEENTNGHVSVLQSKSESKLRCLTTKRKHNINLRLTKSETLYLNKPFDYPNDVMKLDYIIKSFESIEINDDHNKNQYDKSLKILLESDSNESEKPRVFIHNLKQFKESCLLYNVTCVK